MFALFPKFGARTRTQDLWPFLISETGLKFLIWTQSKIHPGQPGSYEVRALNRLSPFDASYDVIYGYHNAQKVRHFV